MSRSNLAYWAASQYWRMSHRVNKNRQQFYRGAHGLRIVTFHDTKPDRFAQFKKIIQWCQKHFDIACPEDADVLFEGQATAYSRDRLLITFDDGWQSNYAAAQWLHQVNIKATFFIVPSLIDRTVEQFQEYHQSQGVKPYFCITPGKPNDFENGLTPKQLQSMKDMGHRIAAHNYAHRNLGQLHTPEEMAYEIDRSVDAVSEFIGETCRDFAIAFGQPHNVSQEACEHLLNKKLRTYLCFRGLNVPAQTCRFMVRHGFEYNHPTVFTKLSLLGGVDHTVRQQHIKMIQHVGCLPAATV